MSVLSPMIQKRFFLISAGSDPSLLPFPALLIVTHPNTPLYYSLLFGIFPLSINPKYAIIKSMVFNVAILTLELANSWTDQLPIIHCQRSITVKKLLKVVVHKPFEKKS